MIAVDKLFYIFTSNLPALVNGLLLTFRLAVLTLFFSTLFGSLIAFIRRSRLLPLKILFDIYVSFIRGTPLLVQVLIFVYGLPPLGIRASRIVVCTIALVVYSSAYVSEIVRAGIQSVPRNQMEAAESLGLSNFQVSTLIVLPQAIKHTIPALGNEFIVIIKQSSVLYAVGISELTFQANKIASQNYLYIETMIVAALIYYVITLILTKALSMLERRLHLSDR